MELAGSGGANETGARDLRISDGGAVEFMLRWLESLDDVGDEGEFGTVAGALARMPHDAMDGKVRDVVRAFPVNDPDAGEAVRVVQEWTIPEFGQVIEPRLRAIREREHEPRLLDGVMQHWGIAMPPRRRSRVSSRRSGRKDHTRG